MTTPLILITGATDGIGLHTARLLAPTDCRLILHGRNPERLQTAHDTIAALARHTPETLRADFSSLADVRAMAQTLTERHSRLDVLLNNAGVYMNEHRTSVDGFELTFAVNHLAPFLLTHLLLDSLAASGQARVVNVSSIAHGRGQLDFDNLQAEQGFSDYGTYALSKLANVLFTVELAQRMPPGFKIDVNALHPGVVSTKLLTDGFGVQGSDTLDESSETSVYLASSPDVIGTTGQYFVRCKPAKINPIVNNETERRRFYELSAQMVGIDPLPLP